MNKVREPFVIAPTALVRDRNLPGGWDVRVYLEIRSYYSEEGQQPAFPSRATIAKNIGCSTDTVDRAIKRLVKTGHLLKQSGRTRHSNRYQFPFRLSWNSRTGADMVAAGEQTGSRSDAEGVAAQERHQPESYNQRYKPERTLRLYHGSDVASVMEDRTIRIQTLQGWVNYGGGDDAPFRFGSLLGKDALDAALKKFAMDLK